MATSPHQPDMKIERYPSDAIRKREKLQAKVVLVPHLPQQRRQITFFRDYMVIYIYTH